MKNFISAALAAMVFCACSVVFAQSRDFHVQRVVLDDGSGHTMMIQAPNGPPNDTLTLPGGSGVSGQAIITDGNGNLSWQTPTSSLPSGALVAFPTSASKTGFTYTGYSQFIATDGWNTMSSMPTARYYPGAAAVAGKLYVIGGLDNSSIPTNVNECYDPTSNTWSTKAVMPTTRYGLGCATDSTLHKIYCVGGYGGGYSNVNEEYDPVANSWSTRAPMPTARNGPTLTEVGNYMYAIGGNVGATYFTTNERYSPPPADTWVAEAPMPTARESHVSAEIGGNIYCVGGSQLGSCLTTNERYNVVANTWTPLNSLPIGTSRACAASFNGKLYFFSGLTNNLANLVAETRIYSLSTDSWSLGTSITTPRGLARAALIGNVIYVVGGYSNNSNTVYPTNEAYLTGLLAYWFSKN